MLAERPKRVGWFRGVECNNVRFRYNYCSMRNAVAAAILIALVVPSGFRFFHLLYLSGLITAELPKATADEIVFGSTTVNHKQCAFGVVDLVDDFVQTNSGKVRRLAWGLRPG